MKIAFVFTPLLLRRNWSALAAQDKYIGIMPPLSLAYAAAIAEKNGHEAIIIDAVAERLSLEQTAERLRVFTPSLIGFTMTTYGFHFTLGWIKAIKARLGVPTIVGGWHLHIYPRQTLTHPAIDYAVTGEAEQSLPNLLRCLESKGSLHEVKGIAFRENGQIIVTPREKETDNLDDIVFPARHLLKNHLYFNVLSQIKNFTVMLSARGCPYRCIFCDLNTKKFRLRSAKNFVDEIESNYRQFDIREFDIYDSSFTIDKERATHICEEITARGLKVSWTARTRVDNISRGLLKKMAQAGCNTIMYGIESADPRLLKTLHKETDLAQIRNAVTWTKEYRIKTLGFFMIGVPGETKETALKTIRFSASLGLDYVQFTKCTPFPNSQIYNRLVAQGLGDYWGEFTKDPSLEQELPLLDTELSYAQAMKLVHKAYLYFYFRPKYILNALTRIKSLLELKNSIRAAFGLIMNS